jgi:integrase
MRSGEVRRVQTPVQTSDRESQAWPQATMPSLRALSQCRRKSHLVARSRIAPFSPHDLRHRRVSLLHLGGMPWARIGELVGHDDLVTTARTYTHVVVDERELDYAGLLG